MKAKDAGFLRQPADLDPDTPSLRTEEKGRAVSEKLQQRQGEILYRKTLIPWPSGCGFH
jgi:hypothetical protein